MPNQFSHPWTRKEIEFLRANIGRLTYVQIGSLIKRTYSSIQSKVRFLPFQKKVRKHSVNSDFFKKWSREMSYVLGFITADGNICHSGNAHTLDISCDDRDVIEKIKATINYVGPVHQKLRQNKKVSYSLRICDQTLFNDLRKLGITERKSLTVIPGVKAEFIVDFLRGFFDGDGTVYLRNTKYQSKLAVAFYTASKPMAEFIHSNLKKLLGGGYAGNIQNRLTKYQKPFYSLSLGHKASLKLSSIMYTHTALYMERKFQKFLQGTK